MTIPEKVGAFIQEVGIAFVASADVSGNPHVAAGIDLKVRNGSFLLFENWFCATTLRNVAVNPRVAIVVTTAEGSVGYQFLGTVVESREEAILDGYVPGMEKQGLPQALIMLKVRVDAIMDFPAREHTDRPLDHP